MLSKQQRQALKLEFFNTPPGTRIPQQLCPVCGGGNSREKKFSVTVDGSGIWYNCFRSSCNTRGFIPYLSTLDGEYVKQKVRKLFEHETTYIPAELMAEFVGRYELTPRELYDNGVVYCPDRGSFIFPIFNYHGFETGKLERWYSWHRDPPGSRPKAVYYTESDAERVHFPRDVCMKTSLFSPRPLYIVEDVLSAIKMARLGDASALLGTSLSDEVFNVIAEVPCSKLIVVLDPDALGKAVDIQKRFGFLKPIEIKYLDNDPKDTPMEELRRLFL